MRALLALVLVGCATTPSDPCTAAMQHVAQCTGETPEAAPMTCDDTRADALLAMSCEDLRDAAADGKADGWWDDFMCLLGFQAHCAAMQAHPNMHTLTGSVHKLLDDSPAVGVYVRAININDASDVHGSWTFAGGLFALQGLNEAMYRIEVALAPTSGALTARTVGSAQGYLLIEAPLP